MRLDSFRPLFQPYLHQFIHERTRAYAPLLRDDFLQSLLDYPAKLAGSGGKRIRPYVAWLMFCSQSNTREPHRDEAALRVLVALELFHLFCLVHDDIIDKGTERYGLPTVQRFVRENMSQQSRLGEGEHIGDAHAILIGDLLFSWAHEAMRSSELEERVLEEARTSFGRMIDEVVIGQMLDVDLMTRRQTTREVIERKIALKTASYTFVRPMQIGASLAGADCDSFCEELGHALGMAFQVQDDLLDLVGTPKTTKKTLFADLRDGTHTLFTQHIFESDVERDIAELRDLMGADLTTHDRDRVLDLFERSGALEAGRAVVRRNLDKAQTLLDDGTLRESERDGFCHLIALLQARDKK